jgi:hypothetical protein
MAKPVYIICAQNGSEDRETGLLSIFHVIEKLQMTTIPVPQPGQPPPVIQVLPFRVFAVWMREEQDDSAQEFEFEMNLLLPPDNRRQQLLRGTLRFEQGRAFHRISVLFATPVPVTQPGMMSVESRLRRAGNGEEWRSQEYPILVEGTQTPQEQAAQTDGQPP